MIADVLTTNPLAKLDAATRMLAEARTLDEVKSIKDTAVAAQAYAKAKGLGEKAEAYAAEIRLEASRRMGQVLIQAKDAGEIRQGQNGRKSQEGIFSLEDVGVTPNESSAAQTLASVPDEQWEVAKTEAVSDGVSTERRMAEVIKKPHVANNSGNNEWYTPEHIIRSAAAVLGEIDLDPASSHIANETVMAKLIYTSEDNGLDHPWRGRVWLNPPYAMPLVGQFIDKLADEMNNGHVEQAIVIVNNATDTKWWNKLEWLSLAVCFPIGRIRFLTADGRKGAPLQGQCIAYIGDDAEKFAEEFSQYGTIWHKLRRKSGSGPFDGIEYSEMAD